MTPNELLIELERRPYTVRVRYMVELGRHAAEDASVAATLQTLERGDFYERSLALQSCYGSRDGEHVLRALGDSSRRLRGLAIVLVPLVCDDQQIALALKTIAPSSRRAMIKGLSRYRRTVAIDAFLDTLAVANDETLGSLLCFGSPAAVERHLPQALAMLTRYDWRSLAQRHSEVAARALTAQAVAAERLDHRLLGHVNAALPDLAEYAPDRALDLVDALLRHAAPMQLQLQKLVDRRPSALLDLLAERADEARVSFAAVADRLDTERLVRLATRPSNRLSVSERWFKRLTPERRRAVYVACAYGWRDADGALDPAIVALLPVDLRQAEGRRHLALQSLAARPTQRLRYAAFVPWDEARVAVEPLLRSPEADLRAAALSTLAAATRYERSRLPELLEIVHVRRHEQDPVRLVMLTALAGLPPSRWESEHLEGIGQILRDALDAADLSSATASAAERLVVALLPFHPVWSVGWLATLVRERGQVAMYGLDRRLSDADVRRIAPVLLPVLIAWETRERESQLVSAAGSFGRRLRVFDALVDLLERVIRETRMPWIADRALALFAAHRPDRLAVLVPSLIGAAGDPSWITRPVIHEYLHRRRQDLLTPFLGQRAYSGRFSTGKTRYVLPIFNGFERWIATQQATFARTLGELAGDEVRDTPAVLSSILRLAIMPAIMPTRLIELASDARFAVRDAALRGLGRLDAGQGIPTLLAALDDDRARIAIYALRRALLEMPPGEALVLLRRTSLERVTVAKEVVRLIGDLRTDEAFGELLAIDGRELHRDVRVALLRAFWSYLEREETWAIFHRAAESSDPAYMRSISHVPTDRLSPVAQRRLARLLADLLTHPEAVVRVDVLTRCAALPITDADRVLLEPLLRALSSAVADERVAAAKAVFETYAGRDARLVGEAIARILGNRRALWSAVQTLGGILRWNRTHLLPTARAVLVVLEADPLTASVQVDLAARALPWNELKALLERLVVAGQLHAGVLATAIRAIQEAATHIDPDGLRELETALTASDEAALRRLALAALAAQAQPPHGWNDERRERLDTYRRDSAPLVAAAAQFTFPPEDEGKD